MKKTTVISTVSFLVLGLTGFTAADQSERMDRFNKIDTNSDGVIVHEELMSQSKVKFDEFDKNKDGFLTIEELPEKMPVPERVQKRMEDRKKKMAEKGKEFSEKHMKRYEKRNPSRIQFVAKMDKDGDEQVSLEEFSTPMVRNFKRADLNGDGSVTKEEALEARSHRGKGKHSGKGKRY